jgi:carboxynorspermidine decarboxylase
LQQFHRLLPALGNQASPGLRINPGRSFQLDPRFDPCRPASKLGIPLAELVQALAEDSTLTNNIKGLHFHTVFASHNFAPMRDAVERLEQALGAAFLNRLEWINLGGGYLFECKEDLAGLVEIAGGLKHRFGVEVYFEPGKAIVGQAGYLAATVLDCFRRDGHLVAVLDTTVNHHPEIFEYQIRPQPAWAEPEQGETVLLAGCTCLAGDVFGEYRFDRPVQVGDRMVFANVGAYSLIKANRFNGYNLPSIYAWDGGLTCRLLQRFDYSDYRRMWVADGIGQNDL